MSILSFIKGKQKQTIVYWGNPQNDGDGKMTFDPPEEITGRWEDEYESMAKDSASRIKIDKDGKEYRSEALVYTTDIPSDGWNLEGYLFLGALIDLPSHMNPYQMNDAYEIKRIDKVPDLNNNGRMFRIHL
jgi:hypothetical protein